MQKIIAAILITLVLEITGTASNGWLNPYNSKVDYAEKIPALKEFVAHYAKQRINTFYIVKVKDDDDKEYLYAYWKEDNSILLLEHFHYFG